MVPHLLAALTCPADAVCVGPGHENSLALVHSYSPCALCKDPLDDRLLAGCDLKSASRTVVVQIGAVQVYLTALETMATQHSSAS